MTTEENSFVDNILANKEYYQNWLDGKPRLNGSIYSRDDIAPIVSHIKDQKGNYYILIEGKRVAERRLDTHLRVRFVKSMGNARPYNPKQRSHQGELPFSIKCFSDVPVDCLNKEKLCQDYYNKAKNAQIEQEDEEYEYNEGRRTEYNILKRSRNRAARNKCLENSRGKCYVCGSDLGEIYGSIGKGFLEVHHKIPIGQYDDEHRVKLKDLYAVCPNCHRIIHRTRKPMDVDILKGKVDENRVKQSEKYDGNYNTIYIVESFSADDSWGPIYAYGKSLFEELCSYPKRDNQSSIMCRYRSLQCKNNWEDFWYELEELCKQGERPIIHFISHGTSEGQKIGNDIIPWKDVGEQCRKINELTHNLFISMNVCYSAELCNYSSVKFIRGCICAEGKVYIGEYRQKPRFLSFYESILNGQTLYEAINAFKNEIIQEVDNTGRNHWLVCLKNYVETKLIPLVDWK